MIANGGKDIVTPDGKLHTDDPKGREATINSCIWMTTAYKEGYIPPEALSWNDANDNNGFHEKPAQLMVPMSVLLPCSDWALDATYFLVVTLSRTGSAII